MSFTKLELGLQDLNIDLAALTPFLSYDTGESYILQVSGVGALPLWYQLRAAVPMIGFWPVLLGKDIYFQDSWDLRNETSRIEVSSVIAKSLAQSPQEWFQRRAQSLALHYQTSYNRSEPPLYEAASAVQSSLEPAWKLASDSYTSEANVFSIPTETIFPEPHGQEAEIRIQPAAMVEIALFPTITPWHVPAYLAFGGWNDSPDVTGHLIAWRWWQTYHQAEIVGIASDKIEAWVFAPPRNTTSAVRLAWEQQVYCPDVIESQDELPTYLEDASVWAFCWH